MKRKVISKILILIITGTMIVTAIAPVLANAADLYNNVEKSTSGQQAADATSTDDEENKYILKPTITTYSELTKSVRNAASLLSDLLEDSKTKKEQELEKVIADKNYDYDLTMKSFYDNTSPYSEADLESLVAACCVVLKKASLNVAEIDFLKMDVTERTVTESDPVKVDRYVSVGGGKYKKDGARYITEPTYVYKYAKDGKYYRRIGKELIEPEELKTTYGEVKLKPADAHDIFLQASISDKEAENMYDSILDSMHKDETLSEDSLVQTIFLETPSSVNNDTSDNLTDEEKTIVDNALSQVSGNRKTIINTAVSLLGRIPYLWGGKATKPGYDTSWWSFNKAGKQKGLDCSGFVQWVYMTAGFPKSTTDGMYSTGGISKNCEEISEEDLQPGDLGLFYNGGSGGGSTNHVGIYLGNGYYIHCSSSKNGVVIGKVGFKVFRRVKGVDTADITPTKVQYAPSVDFDDDDVTLLAKTIWHEVGGEGLNSWIAVGEVIMNRLESDQFSYAHTLQQVIYAPHQFSGSDEIVKMQPSEKCYEVAREIAEGRLRVFNNKNVLFFRNPGDGNNEDWGPFKFYRRIEHTCFYLGKK